MKTIERISTDTPKEIRQLFHFPYEYFSDLLGDKQKTVLDAGCGEAVAYPLLKKKFKKVFLADKERLIAEEMFVGNLESLPLGKDSMDVVFCFETIEHLEHPIIAIENLGRIAKDYLVLGSVNKDGPDFYKGVEIFKAKNGKNVHHVNEMGIVDFLYYIKTAKIRGKRAVQYFSSFEEDGRLRMREQLSVDGLVNYCAIQLK